MIKVCNKKKKKNLQASCFLQFAFVLIRFRVSSADLVALAEDRIVFLLKLFACDFSGFLASIHFLQAFVCGDHVNGFLLIASAGERKEKKVVKDENWRKARRVLPAIEHLQFAL